MLRNILPMYDSTRWGGSGTNLLCTLYWSFKKLYPLLDTSNKYRSKQMKTVRLSGSMLVLDELAHSCFWMLSQLQKVGRPTTHPTFNCLHHEGDEFFLLLTGGLSFAGWWTFYMLLGFSLYCRIFMQKPTMQKKKVEQSKFPWEFRDQGRRSMFTHKCCGWKQWFLWAFNRGSGGGFSCFSSGLFIGFIWRL